MNVKGGSPSHSNATFSAQQAVEQKINVVVESSTASRVRNRWRDKLLPVCEAPTTLPFDQLANGLNKAKSLFAPIVPQLNAVDVMVRALRLAWFGCPTIGPVVQATLTERPDAEGLAANDHEVLPPAATFGPPTVYFRPKPSLYVPGLKFPTVMLGEVTTVGKPVLTEGFPVSGSNVN